MGSRWFCKKRGRFLKDLGFGEMEKCNPFCPYTSYYYGYRSSCGGEPPPDILKKERELEEFLERKRKERVRKECEERERKHQVWLATEEGQQWQAEEREYIIRERNAVGCIHAGSNNTVGLMVDGTVVATDKKCNASGWRNIIAVFAGNNYIVGLLVDGTVVFTDKKHDASRWRDIVAFSTSFSNLVGLKADGTVVGYTSKINGWRDIVAVSAGGKKTVGLKADGTVVAEEYRLVKFDHGTYFTSATSVYEWVNKFLEWSDIVAVSAGNSHLVGLKADGTVVAYGENKDGQCNVSGWCDIVEVSAGGNHTVGLKNDGTVTAVGNNSDGQRDVSGWCDIVEVSAGGNHTVGLKNDGTVIAVGNNSDGQCNVSGWRDIGPVDKEKLLQGMNWSKQGLCRHCGGKMGGFFTKKCKACGKPD